MTDVEAGEEAGGSEPADAPRGYLDRWREGITGGYSAPGEAPAAPPPEPTPEQQRRSVLVLVGVVVLIQAVGAEGHFLKILAVIAVIAAVIMLHELGHFTAAKLSGMKVSEYFLGFGPRLWSIRKGETEYGIKAIPAGGYVRILGMNNLEQVDPRDEPRTYRQASFPKRFAVAVAGSSVHFVLALIAVWTLFAFAHTAKATTTIDALVPAHGVTPAQAAGLKPGDQIVSYDGHPASWSGLHTFIETHAGKPVTLVVKRDGTLVTVRATPADESTVLDPTGVPYSATHTGFLGVSPTGANYSLLGSVPHAFQTFWDDGLVTGVKGLASLFSPHGLSNIGHQVASTPGNTSVQQAGVRPVSIVGIVNIAGQEHGWASEIWLFFVVNTLVGAINLFPLLPFDGGHVAIAVYEAIRSRRGVRYRADVTKMVPYAVAVLALVLFVGLSGAYLDVFHPLSLQH